MAYLLLLMLGCLLVMTLIAQARSSIGLIVTNKLFLPTVLLCYIGILCKVWFLKRKSRSN